MKGKSRVMSKDASKTMKMQHRVKNSDLNHIHRGGREKRNKKRNPRHKNETLVNQRKRRKENPTLYRVTVIDYMRQEDVNQPLVHKTLRG
jgi:hypothetical protein